MVGAPLTLLLFHIDLNIYAYVGLIMLIGIVEKSAIMQIDFALACPRGRFVRTPDTRREIRAPHQRFSSRPRPGPPSRQRLPRLAGTNHSAMGFDGLVNAFADRVKSYPPSVAVTKRKSIARDQIHDRSPRLW